MRERSYSGPAYSHGDRVRVECPWCLARDVGLEADGGALVAHETPDGDPCDAAGHRPQAIVDAILRGEV